MVVITCHLYLELPVSDTEIAWLLNELTFYTSMTGYTSANLFQINIVLSLTENLGFVRSLPKLDTHIELMLYM